MKADVVVIGAGTVGSAIAYGLAGKGTNVLVLDGEDRDFRAATANFGLVWLHGKGMNMPAYHFLSRDAVDLWPEFCRELTDATGADLQYEKNGGLVICLGEDDYHQRRDTLQKLQNQLGGAEPDWEMFDRRALEKLMPKVRLGDQVTGASLGNRDGHANPLRLLAALHAGIQRKGGRVVGGSLVRSISPEPGGGFQILYGDKSVSAGRVVITAGLGSAALAAQVGIDVPIRPERGQLLVTERVEPFLPLPTLGVRQTREGTVMIGATNEDTGFDASTTTAAAARLSADAVSAFPGLGEATLVRQWAGLRVLTPDGFPVYAQSERFPGAFVATCHSGVTLAAIHVDRLADAIIAGRIPASLNAFHQGRFDVPQAA